MSVTSEKNAQVYRLLWKKVEILVLGEAFLKTVTLLCCLTKNSRLRMHLEARLLLSGNYGNMIFESHLVYAGRSLSYKSLWNWHSVKRPIPEKVEKRIFSEIRKCRLVTCFSRKILYKGENLGFSFKLRVSYLQTFIIWFYRTNI